MPLVILIANEKGGCGKTTTAINLSGGLTKARYRVLHIDADPQLSSWNWSTACGPGSLLFTVMPIHLIKGSLREALCSADADVVVMDCPPGALGREWIQLADAIVIPVRPSFLDFWAAATFARVLNRDMRSGTKTAVLVNARQNTNFGSEARDTARRVFADVPDCIVLDSTIGQRAAITESAGQGQSVFDYKPRSTAAHEYTRLTQEIIQWLSNVHPSQTSTL